MDQALTDEERFPLLTDEGRRLLEWLREHPHAPRYNHQCGDRLGRAALERIRAFEVELHSAKRGWYWGEVPAWVKEFAELCLADVPFYRRRGVSLDDFQTIPTCSRADLSAEPWSFVPDHQPLDDLILYATSGTTGHPTPILSHPEVSSKYLPVLRLALGTRGVTLEGGPGKVALILVCAQSSTYTYASVSSYLGEAGFVKLNLNPHEWRDPDDRVRFLDDCRPEVYTGDPISLLELSKLPLTTRPKAMVSTGMTMTAGLQQALEARLGCPVVDVYSMNEARLIAVAGASGHQVLAHDLYTEILDPAGEVCPPGVRGEVTLTGGRNPFLPLLRYRTGDYAALDFRGSVPTLVGLEGRPPTVFLTPEGKVINNIDVSGALSQFALSQFALHQAEDGSLHFRLRGGNVDAGQIRAALLKVFGSDQALTIREMTDEADPGGKVVQYTSAVKGIDLLRSEIKFGA